MKDTRKFSIPAYDRMVERTFNEVRRLGIVKGGEYAGDEDRLANFRRNAEEAGVSMETCWRVYAGKHWDAISQYVRDVQSGKKRPRAEGLAGRADDLIVYLLLFKGMLLEAEASAPVKAPRAPRRKPVEKPTTPEAPKEPAKPKARRTTLKRPAENPAITPPPGDAGERGEQAADPAVAVRRRRPPVTGTDTLV